MSLGAPMGTQPKRLGVEGSVKAGPSGPPEGEALTGPGQVASAHHGMERR